MPNTPISAVSLVQYRNYLEANFSFPKRIHILVGPNGIGKTNVLDAVYLLSFTKGFLASTDSQNIRKGFQEFMVKGTFEGENSVETVYCGFQKGKKKTFKVNGKEYEKMGDHIGKYPAIMISPQDNELISGSAELRRKFLDGLLAQKSPQYLEALVRYGKALAQKNAFLKKMQGPGGDDLLDVLEVQMAQYADVIRKERAAGIASLLPLFEQLYASISNDAEQVGISIQLSGDDLMQEWKANRGRDTMLGYCSKGPHRDELKFTLNGHPIRRMGSQGQQKCFLLALKLAQADILTQALGKTPILLLDDVFDKLDNARIGALMLFLFNEYKGQVIITDTQASWLDKVAPLACNPDDFYVQELSHGETV